MVHNQSQAKIAVRYFGEDEQGDPEPHVPFVVKLDWIGAHTDISATIVQ